MRFHTVRCLIDGRRPLSGLRQVSGFTLVELIVVILVVAIMAALLLPMVAKIRAMGEDAKCTANMRAISAGFHSYVSDNDGTFLPTTDQHDLLLSPYFGVSDYPWSSGNASWRASGAKTPFYCPRLAAQGRAVGNPRLSVIAISYVLGNNATDWSSGQPSPHPAWPRRIANVPSPSKMWIYTEGGLKRNGVLSMVVGALSTGYFLDPQSSAPTLAWPHDGRQNFLFLDGHVEALTYADYIQRVPGSAIHTGKEFWGFK